MNSSKKNLEIYGFGENFRKWINILLGNSNETAKFTGVSVVNAYPTEQFKILRGCRQGDPIAGYLFVLCIELLSLTIQNSKTIPYMTEQGNTKLNDTYADDLTLYSKYFPTDNKENRKNVKYALDCFSIFSTWSGLKINITKTYVTVFGKDVPELPSFVGELSFNYCDSFTLLRNL